MILLGDESIDACRAAVQCIAAVARQGDDTVTRQLTELLGSGCATTRWAALETLSRITLKGDPAVVASLVPCLEDPDPEIRTSAVDALRRVSSSDVRSSCEDMRPCPIVCMRKVAIHGDPVAVQGALQRLDHRDGSVRAAALRTMSWVTKVGDAVAITKALPIFLWLEVFSCEFVSLFVVPQAKGCLDDGVSNVRAAAVETLAKLTPSKGDVEATRRLQQRVVLRKEEWLNEGHLLRGCALGRRRVFRSHCCNGKPGEGRLAALSTTFKSRVHIDRSRWR